MDKSGNKKISVIGAGNMGGAIIRGLIRSGDIQGRNIIVSDPSLKKLRVLGKLGVKISRDNTKAAQYGDIIIMAVKPDILSPALSEIKEMISKEQLIISIAAGVKIRTIKRIMGEKQPVVRVMPNLCATVGMSMSCWVAGNEVSYRHQTLTKKILAAIGKEYRIDEEKILDQITAISGSGPAYVFYLAELLEDAAKKIGLNRDLARTLARQTVIGGAGLLKNSAQSAKELRAGVTSKGGVTETIFTALEKLKVADAFMKAVDAGVKRAKELGTSSITS